MTEKGIFEVLFKTYFFAFKSFLGGYLNYKATIMVKIFSLLVVYIFKCMYIWEPIFKESHLWILKIQFIMWLCTGLCTGLWGTKGEKIKVFNETIFSDLPVFAKKPNLFSPNYLNVDFRFSSEEIVFYIKFKLFFFTFDQKYLLHHIFVCQVTGRIKAEGRWVKKTT